MYKVTKIIIHNVINYQNKIQKHNLHKVNYILWVRISALCCYTKFYKILIENQIESTIYIYNRLRVLRDNGGIVNGQW